MKQRKQFYSRTTRRRLQPKVFISRLQTFTSIFAASKRHRFVAAVIILSLGLFFSEYMLGKAGIFVVLGISVLTNILLLWSNYRDIKDNFTWHQFILPFLFSLACGLFYFLIPARLLTRFLMTTSYAFGLYSLFLSQNIFTIASARTIALFSSARTVSFVMTILSYFFLSTTVFSLHINPFITALLVIPYSFLLVLHSLWTVTLEPSVKPHLLWSFGLTLCLFEVALFLSFWPTTATVIALFLTGFFYTLTGLTQVWFEKRLFRGVLWEYIWVAVIVLLILLLFTSWR